MKGIRVRNGRYNVQVRREGFKPQSGTFGTLKEAEKFKREVESRFDRGVEVDVGELRRKTVRGLLEKFRDDECPHRKGERWEKVRIAHWLEREEFVNRRLDQQLPDAFRVWSQRRLKSVSAATVNREMNLLSGIFSTAIKKWGMPLPANPIHSVARPKVDSKDRGRVWTPEDLESLRAADARRRELRQAAGKNREVAADYVLPAVELAIETAMRLGEVCSVVAGNVHLDERWLQLEETKNGDARKVPLSRRAVQILRPLVEAAAARDDKRVVPVLKDTLGIEYRELRTAAGLEDIRFHDTRHTATSRVAPKMKSVLELAAFTGHRSLQSLKRYYHTNVSDLAKKLDD